MCQSLARELVIEVQTNTLEPQFDGEPGKTFQKDGNDLVKWEMPPAFKPIKT